MTVITLLVGSLLTLIGIVFKLNPPGKINSFYGYRTRTSMRNQETWDAGNKYSSKLMMIFGAALAGIGLISFLLPDTGNDGQFIGIGFFILSVMLLVFLTEKHLNKLFDREGKRK